jgi:hypothetical protein
MDIKTEPTFTIKIFACEFQHLSIDDLISKLQLMHKMNLKRYYSIVEDIPEKEVIDLTGIVPPKPKTTV